MEAEVGTPINYDPNDFMNKEEDHQPDEQKPEPENNEQYYFPPPHNNSITNRIHNRHKRKIFLQI